MAKGTRITFHRSDGTQFGKKSAATKARDAQLRNSKRILQRYYDKKYGKRR